MLLGYRLETMDMYVRYLRVCRMVQQFIVRFINFYSLLQGKMVEINKPAAGVDDSLTCQSIDLSLIHI